MVLSQHTIFSYVPSLILEEAALNPEGPKESNTRHLSYAVLFADISGFTSLTEELAKHGPKGMEELTGILNRYFGRLVDIMSCHGGDILKFAGDALLVCWKAQGNLADAVVRAAQCALLVQQELNGFEATKGVILSLRIAISGGDLRVVHVGGQRHRWEFVLAGQPLIEVGEASHFCQPGSVVVHNAAWGLIDQRCHGVKINADVIDLESIQSKLPIKALKRPQLGPEAEGAIWPYIPGAIRARLKISQDLWLAELRRVTVIFANFPGHDGSVALENSQEMMESLQTILYRYEGSLNKLSVDDKGISLLAAFGLPPLAHEDDSVRALRAAIDIETTFHQFNLPCSIGVATGRAFCGVVGSELRCEYTMMGDVVNLAARLMQCDQGNVLCDHETFVAARGKVPLKALPAVQLKGKKKLIKTYVPSGGPHVQRLRSQHSVVGRERERDHLKGRLAALEAGESSTTIFKGEAGIGKSRLIQEIHEIAESAGYEVIRSATDAMEHSTPFFCWRAIFHQILNLQQYSDPAERREYIASLFSQKPQLQLHLSLLNTILPLKFEESSETQQLRGEIRAHNIQRLLIFLLEKYVERRPLVLTLEDAHWLDSASWSLLRELLNQVEPVMFVITTRPINELQVKEYQYLTEHERSTVFELTALSSEQILELVCSRLGIEVLPEIAAQLIQGKAQGNPFFAEELALALRDTEYLIIEDGDCTLSHGVVKLGQLRTPDTVEGMITERLDRLTPSQQQSLKMASAIGRVFSMKTLVGIYPVGEVKRLLHDLEGLRSNDILDLESPAPNLSYIFRHQITREVTYDLMLFAQRRQLHEAIADWFETTHHTDLNAFYPILAHHWLTAEKPEKALDYLEKAGEQALQNHASDEALDFFNRALLLAEKARLNVNSERRWHWEHQIGEAYYALANGTKARFHLRQTLSLMDQPSPTSTAGNIVGLGTQALRQLFQRLLSYPRKHEQPPAQIQKTLSAARAYERLAQLEYMNNDKFASIYCGTRGLNLAEMTGLSPELARSYANMSVAVSLANLDRLARFYERLALETAKTLDDPSTTAYVLELIGIFRAGKGYWDKAYQYLRESISIAEKLGDQRRFVEGVNTICQTLARQGRFAETLDHHQALCDLGRRRGMLQVQLWGLAGLIHNRSPNQLDESSTVDLSKLLAEHGQAGALLQTDKIYGYGILASSHLALNDQRAALAAAEAVVVLSKEAENFSHYLLEGYSGAVRVYLDLWERDRDLDPQLKQHAKQLCKVLGDYTKIYPIGWPEVYLLWGRLEKLSGRPKKALRRWERSLEWAVKLEMPYVEALAQVEIAQNPNLDVSLKRERLLSAKKLFEDVGAKRQSDRVDELL
jgi:class 3 adenylate cyclase